MEFSSYLKKLDAMIFEGWHRHAQDHYTADAAEIDHHQHSAKKLVTCPKCKGQFDYRKELRATKDREGDIQSWDGNCKCGATLTVFND